MKTLREFLEFESHSSAWDAFENGYLNLGEIFLVMDIKHAIVQDDHQCRCCGKRHDRPETEKMIHVDGIETV